MAQPTYDPATTALLLVDPYNDFLGSAQDLCPIIRLASTDGRVAWTDW
jgi:hypothetical protein